MIDLTPDENRAGHTVPSHRYCTIKVVDVANRIVIHQLAVDEYTQVAALSRDRHVAPAAEGQSLVGRGVHAVIPVVDRADADMQTRVAGL